MLTQKRPQWSSRFAFVLTAIGSSVGLGNLWRFSAELGTNGGSAFLIVYLACILCVGIPVLLSEFIMGRAGQAASAIESSIDLVKKSLRSKFWNLGPILGVSASFLILSFYFVVGAWVLNYLMKFLSNSFMGQTPEYITSEFPKMLSQPWDVFPYFMIFALITIWLVSRGVNKGIELAARTLMPIFFLLLAGLAIYSLTSGLRSGGTLEALKFMFAPDFSKINADVARSALGQACFSIGVGTGTMITYGSYISRDVSLPKSAFIIAGADTFVALIAGLAIFPIVFTYNLEFSSGAGIFFQTLPIALTEYWYLGAAFFFLAFFAAITSSVSLLEPTASYVYEKTKLSKAQSAWACGIAILVLGLCCLFNQAIFDFIDQRLVEAILMPLSALLIVLFTAWGLSKTLLKEELAGEKLGGFIMFFAKWIAPLMMGLILVWGIYDKWF